MTPEERAKLLAWAERLHWAGCNEKGHAVIREMRAAAEQDDTVGTFSCPICTGDSPHSHGETDIRRFASNQIARFGYRVELISHLEFVPVRNDSDEVLKSLRSYTADAASPTGGEGRAIRQAIATIERLAAELRAALEGK
jgi:hypothetical protein